MSVNQVFSVRFLGLLWVFFFSASVIGQNNKSYSPSDLKAPVFDSTGFIIDPGKRINEEWYLEMIGSRETYFFPRYIEPVCVRVDHIKNPSKPAAFADELIRQWDLEKKTNGRFVFQLLCESEEAVIYRVGSRIKPFYKDKFLDSLAGKIAEVHFDGNSEGTGDFVSLQKLGDHIFRKIAFDSSISTYEGNTGIHSIYPDQVERTNDLEVMAQSHYASDDPIFVVQEKSSEDLAVASHMYFEGLSAEEVDEYYNMINLNGEITSVQSVPNAREINNNHVTDPHMVLPEFAEDMINQLLNQLEDSLGYQVAVVCLNSIGDNDPHSWGTDLFNLWGVGEKDVENGLLILLVVDQHAIEFITGRGTEGIMTDIDCYNVQQQEMVPYFKENDFSTGMIRGTQAVCDFFYGNPPLYRIAEDYSDSGDYSYDEYEEPTSFFESGLFRAYMFGSGGLSAAWILFLIISFFIGDYHKRYHTMKFFSLAAWPFIFPLPFALLYFLTRGLMNRWRNTVRFSAKTGEEMHKLGDREEDKHLSKGQISEEKVKSIDYDVWITPSGSDILVLPYKKWFTKYNKCPKCSFKTYYKVYDRTITSATYDSSGTGERCFKCENCGHTKTERYTIPRKTRPSSSSSSGSSGGGYSSSSGGGSSYGGGSSRGGGAGSRW